MISSPYPCHVSPLAAAPAGGDDHAARRWLLQKNCSLSPRQVWGWYLSLTVVSFAFAAIFTLQGLWLVWPFAIVENLALAAALLYYGRHALDRECISVEGEELVVDVVRAERVTRHRFNAAWVRLEWRGRRREALWLCQGREALPVATFLTPARRRRFAAELRTALLTQARFRDDRSVSRPA